MSATKDVVTVEELPLVFQAKYMGKCVFESSDSYLYIYYRRKWLKVLLLNWKIKPLLIYYLISFAIVCLLSYLLSGFLKIFYLLKNLEYYYYYVYVNLQPFYMK